MPKLIHKDSIELYNNQKMIQKAEYESKIKSLKFKCSQRLECKTQEVLITKEDKEYFGSRKASILEGEDKSTRNSKDESVSKDSIHIHQAHN